MRRFALILAVALLSTAAIAQKPKQSSVNNPFGIMLPWAWQQPDKAAQFATYVGVSAYRPLSIFLDRPLLCAECVSARQRRLDLVITLRANGSGGQEQRVPTTPPTDLNAYKTLVQRAAAKWQPLMMAIENERLLQIEKYVNEIEHSVMGALNNEPVKLAREVNLPDNDSSIAHFVDFQMSLTDRICFIVQRMAGRI
jgi:hypothetical protein